MSSTGARLDVTWPRGYRVRFIPQLEVVDASGTVVLHDRDPVTGACVASDPNLHHLEPHSTRSPSPSLLGVTSHERSAVALYRDAVATDEGRIPALTIEVPDGPRSRTCPDCGQTVLDSTGFVYREGSAFAIYHATLHEHGGRPTVDMAIGIGTWIDDDAVADASAFLAAWATADHVQFGFVDPWESGWHRARRMANQLTADQARVNDRRAALLAVAELIVADDPAVKAHLA